MMDRPKVPVDFVPTSLMHRKAHEPTHRVRIYDMGEVHVVCADCGMHDWGDWGNDESQYTVENFRAKYGDRVLGVETFDDAAVELWECPRPDCLAYTEEQLTRNADGTRGHLRGPDIDDEPIVSTCPGPVEGPVKGY